MTDGIGLHLLMTIGRDPGSVPKENRMDYRPLNRILHAAVFCFMAASVSMPGPGAHAAQTQSTPAAELPSRESSDLSEHYYRGVTLESAGRLEEAMGEYRRVIRLSPAHGDARGRLAEIHLLRGETAEAIEQFKVLARYQEHNPVIRYRLARLYESDGNYRKATDEYREAARVSPDSLPIRRRLALLYVKRNMPDKAASEYRGILAIDPRDTHARNSLIALYLRGKKYDELTGLLQETVARKPDDPTGHYKLGLVHEFRKNYDAAAQEYGRAVELDASHAKSMKALARVYLKLGKVDDARRMMEAAIKVDPSLKQSTLLLHNFNEEFKPAHVSKKKKSYRKSHKKKKGGKAKISKSKKSKGKKVYKKKKPGSKKKVSRKKNEASA